MDDQVPPIMTKEMVDKISSCFSSMEEGTDFVRELIFLSREMVNSMKILNYLDEDKAYELIIRNLHEFSRFFRDNIEIMHSLINCVDTEPKI